jgi:cation/acetate symporter
LFGISPEGIGFVGMLLNIGSACAVSLITGPPPANVQDLVENIRIPAGVAREH